MKLPRDLTGRELLRALTTYGYAITGQTGSHIRATTMQGGEHHITVPDHRVLRIGTLAAILGDVSAHLGLPREEVVRRLFG